MHEGVRIFRVDNPHTKAFPFWQWMITDIKRKHPDVLFLSEAFTRPKMMYRLAKLGFSQSYTYFTWRNEKQEIIEYFTELTTPPVNQFFRPNLWPNTPDILPGMLQSGLASAYHIRFLLAALLGANYGMYGPAFELFDHEPRDAGGEEYLNSEKYELKNWNWESGAGLRSVITQVNQLRRQHPALQHDAGLRFHPIDNDRLLAFSKHSPDGRDLLLAVVSLDPRETQTGRFTIDQTKLPRSLPPEFEVNDLLSHEHFVCQTKETFVSLSPERPGHLFQLPR